VHDLIDPVRNRLYAMTQDRQWIIPAKREAVGRLLGGIDAAWTAYRNELYGGGFNPLFDDCGQIREDDGGPTAADIAGEVHND